MRDYGKVSPHFWTGKTGKSLRGHPEAQIVALYLMTSPHANMIGVYHLPLLYLAHETGLPLEGALKGLVECRARGFCTYDDETETVFVTEMAAHQIGETLKASDNRTRGIVKQYQDIGESCIKQAFFDRYGEDYGLPEPEEKVRGLEAPSEPLHSPHSQEQEKKQEKKGRGLPTGNPPAADLFPGVTPQVLSDFLAIRRAKKAPLTETAAAGIRREAEKAGLALQEALELCCERGWSGFKADWEGVQRRPKSGPVEPAPLPRLRA